MRYNLFVRYNGALFSGSARNPGMALPGVTDILQDAITKFVGDSNCSGLQGSSRTDAGVHAIRNAFHVDMNHRLNHNKEIMEPHKPSQVQGALNFFLPKGVEIDEVWSVPESFHTRFDAIGRTYMYRILHPCKRCLFQEDRAWFNASTIGYSIHAIGVTVSAGKTRFFLISKCWLFITNALSRFAIIGYSNLPFTCDTIVARTSKLDDYSIRANSFVYKMVRNIVGALVSVGKGEITAQDIGTLLDKKDRTLAPATAPARGLYLVDVHYPPHVIQSIQSSLASS